MPSYLFGGSRVMVPMGVELVKTIARIAALGYADWHVGDALGADSVFIESFLMYSAQPQRLHIFSVESSGHLRPVVRTAADRGAHIVLPPPSLEKIPFPNRLAARSSRAAKDVSGAWLVADRVDSKGTFATAAIVAKAAKPVRVFPLFPVIMLDPLKIPDVGYWESQDLFGVPFALWQSGIPF